jgi:hypothetical protein
MIPVKDILIALRYRIGDTEKAEWSDDELLRVIGEVAQALRWRIRWHWNLDEDPVDLFTIVEGELDLAPSLQSAFVACLLSYLGGDPMRQAFDEVEFVRDYTTWKNPDLVAELPW